VTALSDDGLTPAKGQLLEIQEDPPGPLLEKQQFIPQYLKHSTADQAFQLVDTNGFNKKNRKRNGRISISGWRSSRCWDTTWPWIRSHPSRRGKPFA